MTKIKCPKCGEEYDSAFSLHECKKNLENDEENKGEDKNYGCFQPIDIIVGLFLLFCFSIFIVAIGGGGKEKIITPPQSSEFQQEVFQTFEFVDNLDGLRLRAEPSLSAEILEILEDKTRVEILVKKDEWAEVKIKNSQGWVANKYLISSKKKALRDSLQAQEEKKPETKEIQSSPKFIGKWFGEVDVYLGGDVKTDHYAALFEPFLSRGDLSPIYKFLLNLVDYVWGQDQLISLVPQLEERDGTVLIFYEGKNNSKFYFLLMKEDAGNVAGVSFWRE